MFSRFTNRAYQSMRLAVREAERLHHDALGTEHLLLGLLAEGNSAAASALCAFGVDLLKARDEVGRLVGPCRGHVNYTQLPFSRTLGSAMQAAVEESQWLEHRYIGPEHLLLGLLRVEGGLAVKVLRRFKVDPQDIREHLARFFAATGAAAGGKTASFQAPATTVPKGISGSAVRLTNRALSTLDIARREAERLKQDHLGTEHLLLGLLVEGANIAAQVLQQREVDAKKVRTILFKLISPSPRYTPEGPLALTSQAQDAVQSALAAARTLGHDYVGPEHLLLGLLCVPVGPATHVFRQLELKPETLREDVLAALSAIPPLAEDRKGDPSPTEGEDTVPPGRPDQGAGVSFTYDPSLFRRVDEEPQAVETNQPSCERGPLVLEQAGALGREAVLLSLPVAEDLRHDYVGTEHLLLGLIDKASGPVAELLKEAMCDFEKAEASVLALIPPGGAAHEAALPFTPRFKRVVGSAKAAADARQHRHAPADYLLLALLEEDKGTAYRILADLKVDPCSLREKLLARLDSADALNETTDGRG